jgi:hypothetical protein
VAKVLKQEALPEEVRRNFVAEVEALARCDSLWMVSV